MRQADQSGRVLASELERVANAYNRAAIAYDDGTWVEKQEEDLWTQAQAARYIGVNDCTLHNWRKQGKGPRVILTETNRIRYRVADIHEYLERLKKH